MIEAPVETTEQPRVAPVRPRRWRRFFRFSLLTLVLLSLTLGSGGLLHQRTKDGPWRRTALRENVFEYVAWGPNGKWVAVQKPSPNDQWELLDCKRGTS